MQSDKAILAKYSGSGSGLKSRDGKMQTAIEARMFLMVDDVFYKKIN